MIDYKVLILKSDINKLTYPPIIGLFHVKYQQKVIKIDTVSIYMQSHGYKTARCKEMHFGQTMFGGID